MPPIKAFHRLEAWSENEEDIRIAQMPVLQTSVPGDKIQKALERTIQALG